MFQPERYDILVLGSGAGGKLLAWHLARSGRKTAVVERRYIGGSCPNINCLPSKNEIWSAKVAHLARHGAQFGTVTGHVTVDMATVRQRKRDTVHRQTAMVEGLGSLFSRCPASVRAIARAKSGKCYRGNPRRDLCHAWVRVAQSKEWKA
jgi:choline dehydrogenase-like flavoprotein